MFHKGETAKLLPFEKAVSQDDMPPAAYDSTIFILKPATELPIWIANFSDNAMGGSSEMNAAIVADGAGPAILQLTGKIVKKGFIGFAGTGIMLARTATVSPVDISGYTAIEFEAKGDGGKYSLALWSSKVHDYNYHSATFNTTADWHTVRISCSDLKQNQYYGKQVPLDLKTIGAVSFYASGDDRPFEMNIRNVHFVR